MNNKSVCRVGAVVVGVVLLCCNIAAAVSWRDQLALAEKDEDTYAQIELIRRILDKEPNDDKLREQLADLWLSIDDCDMAEAVVRDWKAAPEALRVRVLATGLFARDDKKSDALALLEGYVAKYPEDLEATSQLIKYLDAVGEPEKIVEVLRQAPGVETNANLLVSRALARRKLQDFAGALKDFAAADKADPEEKSIVNHRPAFDRLQAALAGIESANTLLKANPNDPAAHLSRAYWYLFAGFANELALEDAEAAHKLAPNSVAVRILVAVASHRAGRLSNEQARERLQVDVTKSIPTVEALKRLFESDNDVERNAREISPLLERASTLNETAGQYLLALRDAEAALAINPKSTQARATKVSTLAKLANIESAVAEFRKLEPSKPPRDLLAQILNDLAEAALNASQLELALEFSERSIRTLPTAYAYKQRAAILQRVDRFADAQEDLARAQQLETEESR